VRLLGYAGVALGGFYCFLGVAFFSIERHLGGEAWESSPQVFARAPRYVSLSGLGGGGRPSVKNSCTDCHATSALPSGGHDFGCEPCHGGDARSSDRETAHRGVLARPGAFVHLAQGCGRCHTEQHARLGGGGLHPDLVDRERHPEISRLCRSCHFGPDRLAVREPRRDGCGVCHALNLLDPEGREIRRHVLPRPIPPFACLECHFFHQSEVRFAINLGKDLSGRFSGDLGETMVNDPHWAAGMGCAACHPSAHHGGGAPRTCSSCHPDDQTVGQEAGSTIADLYHGIHRQRIQCVACHGGVQMGMNVISRRGKLFGFSSELPRGGLLRDESSGRWSLFDQVTIEDQTTVLRRVRACAVSNTRMNINCFRCHGAESVLFRSSAESQEPVAFLQRLGMSREELLRFLGSGKIDLRFTSDLRAPDEEELAGFERGRRSFLELYLRHRSLIEKYLFEEHGL